MFFSFYFTRGISILSGTVERATIFIICSQVSTKQQPPVHIQTCLQRPVQFEKVVSILILMFPEQLCGFYYLSLWYLSIVE